MLFNCFKYINACFDVFFSQFGSGISVRVSYKARQAGPGTGSADSSDRSPPPTLPLLPPTLLEQFWVVGFHCM